MTQAVQSEPRWATASKRKRYPCCTVQVRASASFAKTEVDWLNSLLSAVQRGADVRVLARHKASAIVARKARSMRAAIAAKSEARKREDASLPHRSGLTLQQTADALGIVSKWTVHRWIREGKLVGTCHGQFGYRSQQADVDAFTAAHSELLARTRLIPKRKLRSDRGVRK